MAIEIICGILWSWGYWLAITIVAGFLGLVIPGPKQILELPAIVAAVITLLSALNTLFKFCAA